MSTCQTQVYIRPPLTLKLHRCKEFAAKGCKVYATARRVEAMSTLTHPSIERTRLDVTDEASVQSVVDGIVEKEGRIDILVNNAGVTCSGECICSSK